MKIAKFKMFRILKLQKKNVPVNNYHHKDIYPIKVICKHSWPIVVQWKLLELPRNATHSYEGKVKCRIIEILSHSYKKK